jgi:hypothetical protein
LTNLALEKTLQQTFIRTLLCLLLTYFAAAILNNANAQEQGEQTPKATQPAATTNTDNKAQDNNQKTNNGDKEPVRTEGDTAAQEKTPVSTSTDDLSEQYLSRKDIVIADPVDAHKQQKEDLQHYLSSQNVTPMLVGPNDYLTLVENQSTANNKGVMIIIPDWQQTAVSPKAFNQLRQYFPDKGWTTITIQPPSKPKNYPSQALSRDERIESNAETLMTHQTELAEILKAATMQAKNYPGIIIVISEGKHAALLMNIYQEEQAEVPSALVMLSSFLPTIVDNEKSAKNMALSTYPTLDLYLKRDHRLANTAALNRKHLATNEMKTFYRQRQLYNTTPGYYPHTSLVKEISGWLHSIGW